ncbi:MAG: MFS transporter [Actinobacteria bacterium]|nr:MFS transporter [Actinomycetota bacterium]
MTLHAGAALRPLRYRNFAILWSASLVSNVGSWMQTVAVGALVVSRTGQASWAVLVAAGAFLPIGLLSPLGGALADRLPRRPVIAAGNLAEGLIAAALAGLVSAGQQSPLLLLGLVTLQGCAAALILPFSQAILPDLVPRSDFLAAASLNSAQWNAGRIVGPALAGATIAAFGFGASFAGNSVSFLAVVAAMLFVRLSPPPGRTGSVLVALRDGFSAAKAQPSCRAAIITIGVVAFVAAPFIALVPVMALRLSHGGPTALAAATSQLTTAQGLGAVSGALLLAPLAARIGRGRLLAWSLAMLPVALTAYAVAPSRWWGVAALFVVGLVYLAVLSGLSTTVQLYAPPAYRGRVISFFQVALGVSYPIGALLQGPLADAVGIGWTTAGSAVLLGLVGLVTWWQWPAFGRALLGTEQSTPGDDTVQATAPDMAR